MRHIKGKDLNLLLVFNALWLERNVTHAAKRVGVSQPALSRALSRLRSEFSDPLFVRTSRGVQPTAKAIEISSSVASGLESIAKAYSPDLRFAPERINRVVTIVCSDYIESLAASFLVPKILNEAPGLVLNFRSTVGVVPKESLEKGDVDLVISGLYETLSEGFYKQKILTDYYKSAVRRDHPVKKVSAEEFAKLYHILVTPKGDLSGVVDSALSKIGKKRRVAMGTASFLSAALAVSETDLVFSAPGLLIDRLKAMVSLRDFPTPLPLPKLEIFQIWHSRCQDELAMKWLRSKIVASFKDLSVNS